MGPLAEPALRTHRKLFLALASALAFSLLVASCNGGDDDSRSPSVSPTARPATPSVTAETGPGEPGVSSARALEHVWRLAVEIGSRPAGSENEQRAADYIREELASALDDMCSIWL